MKNLTLKCPICGKKSVFKRTIDLRLHRASYVSCSNCSGGILYPQPDRKKIIGLYKGPKYFGLLSKPVDSPILQWFLTKRIFKTPAEWVMENFSKKGSILDVGCGNGEFLYFLMRNGWNVSGSDISGEAVKRTSKLLEGGEKNIKRGEFNKQRFGARYDLISFWHVLEHLKDPLTYAKKARNLLKKKGSIIGELPNFGSFNLHFFVSDYAWIMIPDHVIYFNTKSLKIFLQNAGFKKINFFYPKRGLMNFSISLKNRLNNVGLPKALVLFMFIISIPLSVIFVAALSYFDRSEVIRFSAQK